MKICNVIEIELVKGIEREKAILQVKEKTCEKCHFVL